MLCAQAFLEAQSPPPPHQNASPQAMGGVGPSLCNGLTQNYAPQKFTTNMQKDGQNVPH